MPGVTAFYSQAGGVHLAGNDADALARLPAGLAALTEVAHGLIVHEHMAGMYGFELAEERRASVHIRPVSRCLTRSSPRTAGRWTSRASRPHGCPGNCRHFTVLTVAAPPGARCPGAGPVRLRRVLRHRLV